MPDAEPPSQGTIATYIATPPDQGPVKVIVKTESETGSGWAQPLTLLPGSPFDVTGRDAARTGQDATMEVLRLATAIHAHAGPASGEEPLSAAGEKLAVTRLAAQIAARITAYRAVPRPSGPCVLAVLPTVSTPPLGPPRREAPGPEVDDLALN
jgi:hypothetical protein